MPIRRLCVPTSNSLVLTALALCAAEGAAIAAPPVFAPAVNYQTDFSPAGLAIGDWDGDGDIDLAVTVAPDDQLELLVNAGDGTFAAGATFQLPTGGAGFAAPGDVDGDGDIDLAISLEKSGAVRMMRNFNSSFTALSTASAGLNPGTIVPGQFGGDGSIDFAVACRNNGLVRVLTNNGAGVFAGTIVNVGAGPRGLAAGDWDGDGHLDLAVALQDEHAVRVILSDGAGGFAAQPPIALGLTVSPMGLAAGDLDGDGDTDLAVSFLESATGGAGARVLVNEGGTLIAGAAWDVPGTNPAEIAAADLNLDARIDLVVTDADGSSVAVLENLGRTFAAAMVIDVGANPGAIAIGDLNGDGVPDVAVNNKGANTTSVLINESQAGSCVADCDLSGALTIDDFICFQTFFALGDPAGDCDLSGTLTIDDFICFQTLFALGC